MFSDHPPPLSTLLADLTEAFAHPAAHGAGVEFPADLTALWAEALREASRDALKLETLCAGLIRERDALALTNVLLAQNAPGTTEPSPAPAPAHEGVIDMTQVFLARRADRNVAALRGQSQRMAGPDGGDVA